MKQSYHTLDGSETAYTPPKIGSLTMKWVTRERPKIDRIACPWLINRFIDDEPEFLYVPSDKVLSRQGPFRTISPARN